MIGIQQNEVEKYHITETVERYFKATQTGESKYLSQAFHMDAKLKHIKEDGTLYEADLNHFSNYLDTNGPMPVLETKILSIDTHETGASVKAQFTFNDFTYTDYLNLLKIEGEWKIVDKIYIKTLIK